MSYVGRILNPPALQGVSAGVATFTSSGTWVCPAGVTYVNLQVQGAGGGGAGGGLVDHFGGGGGGAGALTTATSVAVVPGTSYTVTIGAAGAGATATLGAGNNGSSGGTSSIVISSTYSAVGGSGGDGSGSGNVNGGIIGGGAGGAGTFNGTTGTGAGSFAGGLGGTASGADGGGGGGGASNFGHGGNGGNGAVAGNNGVLGAGGGGGGGGGGGLGTIGGDGGSGYITITMYPSLPFTNLNFNPQSTTTNIATAGNSIALGLIQSTSNNTDHVIGQYVAAPATPYCVIANISMNQGDMAGFSNFATKVYGIGFYDGTKAVTSVSAWNSPNPATMLGGVFEWTNVNSISNVIDYTRKTSGFPTGTLNWIQIEDDGTNIKFFYGCDGTPTKAPTHWAQYYTQGRTSFLSNVNYICYMTDFAGNSIVGSTGFQDSYLTLKSWQIIKL